MDKRLKTALGIGIAAGAAIYLIERKSHAPLATVESVDLERYQGKWYEIAKLPQRYERDCYCVYAEYEKDPDGFVWVHNSCRKDGPTGPVKEIRGKAFAVPNSGNSKLKVQFFWPFTGDYWILKLDPEYQHVLVGSPDRKSLWILSRTPIMDESAYREMIGHAERWGFPIENVTITPQCENAHV